MSTTDQGGNSYAILHLEILEGRRLLCAVLLSRAFMLIMMIMMSSMTRLAADL